MNRISAPSASDNTPTLIEQIIAFLGAQPGLPLLLALAFAAIVLAGGRSSYRRRQWNRSVRQAKAEAWTPGKATDTAQLPTITRADIERVRVLNRPEQQLFRLLRELMPDHFHSKAELLAQVSLAEFLWTKQRDLFWTYSSQRVDFLVVDSSFNALCAIEYQGRGHKGHTANDAQSAYRRDWNKRRVLDAADIPLIEVPEQFSRDSVAAQLSQLSGRGRQRAAG